MKKNNNKCEECYKNGKIPSDIDCAKCGVKGINFGFDDIDDLLEENRRLLLELRKAEEMRNCYEHNLQLCTFQERQIGKLADTLKKVMDIIDNGCYPEFEWLKEEYK